MQMQAEVNETDADTASAEEALKEAHCRRYTGADRRCYASLERGRGGHACPACLT